MTDTKPKILIVDNEPNNHRVYERILEPLDLDIIKAMSGQKALEVAYRHDFFLIVMDVQMPNMDGFETASLILDHPKTCHIPLIFITAMAKDEVFEFKGYKSGAIDYLIKPINDDILRSKVRIFLELHQQKKQLHSTLEELQKTHGELVKEIAQRKRAEEELMRSNAELAQMAQFDSLTGLANRGLFMDRLPKALGRADRTNKMMALMFLDLDRFKMINDTFGHDVGDLLLQSVAERLEACLCKTDTVARLGGDEFTLILEGFSRAEHAAAIAQKILDVMALPFVLDNHEIFVTTSIGIAIYPLDGDNIDNLLKNADTAMYHAKEGGRNTYQFYTAEMNVHTAERLTLESDLRRALQREEFRLHYQPQFSIMGGEITGIEALVRWQHPELGLVSPAKFIPLAEETGLIVPIGEWVLRTACAQNKAWQSAGLKPVRVSINLSARQFLDKGLFEKIAKVIAEGVETEDQLRFLRSLRCDEVQSFLLSLPVPSDQVTKLLSPPTANHLLDCL